MAFHHHAAGGGPLPASTKPLPRDWPPANQCGVTEPAYDLLCYALCIMINDMILAILIAFATVAAFNLLSRIWEYFGVPG